MEKDKNEEGIAREKETNKVIIFMSSPYLYYSGKTSFNKTHVCLPSCLKRLEVLEVTS
jgi:hypothetical protein